MHRGFLRGSLSENVREKISKDGRLKLRKTFLAVVVAGVLAAAGEVPAGEVAGQAEGALPVLKVWKSPTCGCCNRWVDHMRAAGFRVEATDVGDIGMVKRLAGIPPRLESCHTAIVAGYRIEGHVPAADVRRLLEERPAIAGLAVPGMVTGSPGMEAPDGTREPYDVLAFGRKGVEVFARHR